MAGRGRYTSIRKKTDPRTKNRILEGSLYPRIDLSARDKYITTKFGDRLDALSDKYYGSTQHWWILAQANNITGTLHIKPGTKLRIPTDHGYILQQYEDLNNKG